MLSRRVAYHPGNLVLSYCLFLVLCCAGCTPYLAPPGMPTHSAVGEAALNRANGDLQQVVARAEIEVNTPLTTDVIHANVVLRAPGDLRLELLTPTGDMLAIFVANESEKRLFRRGEDSCLVHVNCGGDLSGILPLPIQASDLVSILLGGGPRDVQGEDALRWDSSRGAIVFEERGGVVTRRIVYLDACSLELKGAEWWTNGELQLRWQGHETGSLIFDVPGEGVEVTIRLPVRDESMLVEDDAFEFDCPVGVTPRVMRCVKAGVE